MRLPDSRAEAPVSKKLTPMLLYIKKYAVAVAKGEQFAGVPATLMFVANSNELDPYARKDAIQRVRQKGRSTMPPIQILLCG